MTSNLGEAAPSSSDWWVGPARAPNGAFEIEDGVGKRGIAEVIALRAQGNTLSAIADVVRISL